MAEGIGFIAMDVKETSFIRRSKTSFLCIRQLFPQSVKLTWSSPGPVIGTGNLVFLLLQ